MRNILSVTMIACAVQACTFDVDRGDAPQQVAAVDTEPLAAPCLRHDARVQALVDASGFLDLACAPQPTPGGMWPEDAWAGSTFAQCGQANGGAWAVLWVADTGFSRGLGKSLITETLYSAWQCWGNCDAGMVYLYTARCTCDGCRAECGGGQDGDTCRQVRGLQ